MRDQSAFQEGAEVGECVLGSPEGTRLSPPGVEKDRREAQSGEGECPVGQSGQKGLMCWEVPEG